MWNIDLPAWERYDFGDPKLPEIVQSVQERGLVAIDTETTGLNIMSDRVLFWSLSWDEAGTGRRRRLCMEAATLEYFREVFADPTMRWIMANAKFDMHMIANGGHSVAGAILAGECADVAVMHALLNEEKSHALKDMAFDVLGWKWSDFFDTFRPQMVPDESKPPKKLKGGKLSQPTRKETVGEMLLRCNRDDPARLNDYASNDAFGTLQLYYALEKQLLSQKTYTLYPEWLPTMADLFFKTEVPFTKVLWKCERNGIFVNPAYMQERRGPMVETINRLERQMVAEAEKVAQGMLGESFHSDGSPFKPNSLEDQKHFYFDLLELRPLSFTGGGKSGVKNPSVDAKFLEHYAQETPMAKYDQERRKLTKLISTYIDGGAKHYDRNYRIHTRYNQDVARTGRLSSSEPNCFSGDTEVLTREGWLRLDTLPEQVPVAQWNNGVVSFVVPTAYVGYRKEQVGRLIRKSNQHIDLAFTPDHRCPLRHRKTGEWRLFTAEEYPEDWQQIHAGHYSGGSYEPSEEELIMLCATQADGSWSYNSVDFSFKKSRKIVRLLGALTKLGWDHTVNTACTRGRTRICVKGEAVSRLRRMLGGSKQFGPWVLDLARERLDFFCEEIFRWDGCITRMNHYSSNSKNNADWVQAALLLSGARANVREYQGAKNINYQVDVTHRDYSMTTNVQHEDLGCQQVYCVSVPSSYLLVRRNGKACVTGNCQNIPKLEGDIHRLRGAFQATPGNVLIVGDYEQLEMRLLACGTVTKDNPGGAKDMIQIFLDGKDIHMGNAEMVYGPLIKQQYGWDLTYDFLKEAKKIDGQVKAGKLPPEALTERHHIALEKRNHIKAVGFGINYGMREARLGRNLGISKEAALGIINTYFETYPAVAEFFETIAEDVRQCGFSYTVLGRRRSHTQIFSQNKMDRAAEEREATSMTIQGTAADVVKMAMIKCDKAKLDERLGCYMLLQIHDELVFECKKETADIAKEEIRQCMEHALPTDLIVPLTVSLGIGDSWATAK